MDSIENLRKDVRLELLQNKVSVISNPFFWVRNLVYGTISKISLPIKNIGIEMTIFIFCSTLNLADEYDPLLLPLEIRIGKSGFSILLILLPPKNPLILRLITEKSHKKDSDTSLKRN